MRIRFSLFFPLYVSVVAGAVTRELKILGCGRIDTTESGNRVVCVCASMIREIFLRGSVL